MAFEKGKSGNPAGKKKGTASKKTIELREMILQALNGQKGGGVAYLKQQAQENPAAFMTLLGKTLPRDLNATVETGPNLASILSKLGKS
jgi:hypothetical protein